MSYVTHANADLTPKARAKLARLVVEEGWTLRRAAERFQCSPATAKKWVDRYRVRGEDGMADASSRPRRSPKRTPVRTERRIVGLRFNRRWGPHRIAAHLGLARSTVGKVLTRYRMPRLACLDQGTGLPVRTPAPQRYEHENPGDLIHVDIKKLGRIPDGGGHRALGRAKGQRNRRAGTGYAYLHHAVDDHTRLAYSEILNDEKKETAAAFLAASRRILRRPRHHRQSGAHGQRVLLPLPDLRSSPGTAPQTPAHPPLPTPNQRQGGTLQPHPRHRMGLRPALHLRNRARRHLPGMAPPLQSSPNPYRHRRQNPHQPRSQPQWELHLEVVRWPCC